MKTRCELDAPGRQQTYSADMKEPPCEMYCRRTALNIRHLTGNCSVYVLQKIEIRKNLPAADREMGSYVFYLSKCPKCPIGLQARLEPCRGCSHQSWSPQTVAAKWRLSGFRGYHPRGWESPISGSSHGAWWAAGQGFSWLTPPHALHISWVAVWADYRQAAGVAP